MYPSSLGQGLGFEVLGFESVLLGFGFQGFRFCSVFGLGFRVDFGFGA